MAEQCGRETKAGTPCKAPRVTDRDACAGHLGLGLASDPATYSRIGNAASVAKRQARAEARKRTPQDWLALKLEERAETLINAALDHAEQGDTAALRWAWEAAYGKAVERVATASNDSDIRALTPAQRRELRQRAILAHPELAELIPSNEAGLPSTDASEQVSKNG